MPIWNEHRFSFTLPNGRAFRFSQCAAYGRISGKGVKEMDFAWLEGQTLWLMEFKDYGVNVPAAPKQTYLQDNLAQKVEDSLMMLGAVWSQTAFGDQLRSDIIQTCAGFPQHAINVRPVVVMNLERPDATRLINPLKDELKNRLEGELHCFGISYVPVLPVDHDFVTNQLSVGITRRP